MQIGCASSDFVARRGKAGRAGREAAQDWPEEDKLSYPREADLLVKGKSPPIAADPHEGQEASVRSNHAAAARSL